MKPMHSVAIPTQFGEKTISVYSCNILEFEESIDILTVSAFTRSYVPTPGTMFAALDLAGIDAEALAEDPSLDLRNLCNMWISDEIVNSTIKVGRLACIEMSSLIRIGGARVKREENILNLIKAFFRMLDLASLSGIKVESVAMPLIGAGCQGFSPSITIIPIINECITFLQRNEFVKNFYFIDYNQNNAFQIAMALENSYSIHKNVAYAPINSGNKNLADHLVFISHSSCDKNIADNLCSKLESRGLKVWYAPRDIHQNDYASSIVSAISRCTHFIVIISKESMNSNHVLNEIDLAFKELDRNIRFLPLRLDDEDLRPAFSYYLSRQHWMDAHLPPLELRLEEFVTRILEETV